MATNLSGLFGNTTRSPQEYRQELVSGMLAQDARRGSQSTSQSAIDLAGEMGANLGSGLGQLFGGKTAAQVRDASINDAMKKVSEAGYDTEYEKMAALSKELGNMGMSTEAQQAFDRANQLQMDALSIQKAQKDLQLPATRDVYDNVTVFNPITQQQEVKSVRRTEYWNPETKQYQRQNPSATQGGGQGGNGGDETPPPANDQQAKAKAILEQRKADGTYTNPVVTPRMPQGTPIPPDLRNQRGFQGQGMINPEGF